MKHKKFKKSIVDYINYHHDMKDYCFWCNKTKRPVRTYTGKDAMIGVVHVYGRIKDLS